MNYKIHPVAAMFPIIAEGSKEWADLCDSIERFGQLEPIIVDGDLVIDGRNRLGACKRLSIAPIIREWKSLGCKVSQAEWIEAKNINRRHLTADQRASIITAIMIWEAEQVSAEAKRQGNSKGGKSNMDSCSTKRDTKEMHARSTVGKIAEKAGVSHHKAAQAVKVAKAARENPEAAEVQEQAASGAITLAEAVKKVSPAPKSKPEPTLQEKVAMKWSRFMDGFAVSDHAQVKTIVKGLL